MKNEKRKMKKRERERFFKEWKILFSFFETFFLIVRLRL